MDSKTYFPWIWAGDFRADYALQVDHLTMVMLLVVTGVGFVIHIYSAGYMAHEEGYGRFFSYLNLFMFFMLTLVLAANYVLLFVGWEGVGLCSYLLIGFWFLKKTATDAGNKAFWVNRVGDFGFLLGMFLIFRTFGSLDFTQRAARRERAPVDRRGTLRHAHLDRARTADGRVRQIRADSALRLAAGRDGRPHAGQRADPRRDDGYRGRICCRAVARNFSAFADRHGNGRRDRLRHRAFRRNHRAGANRHQESSRVFHHQPARLHVSRVRSRARFPREFSI